MRTVPKGEDQDYGMTGTGPGWVLGWAKPPQLKASAVSGKGEEYVPYSLEGFGIKQGFLEDSRTPQVPADFPRGQQRFPGTTKAPQGPPKLLRDKERSSEATKASQGPLKLPKYCQSSQGASRAP